MGGCRPHVRARQPGNTLGGAPGVHGCPEGRLPVPALRRRLPEDQRRDDGALETVRRPAPDARVVHGSRARHVAPGHRDGRRRLAAAVLLLAALFSTDASAHVTSTSYSTVQIAGETLTVEL